MIIPIPAIIDNIARKDEIGPAIMADGYHVALVKRFRGAVKVRIAIEDPITEPSFRPKPSASEVLIVGPSDTSANTAMYP